jgi:hypothetical protein
MHSAQPMSSMVDSTLAWTDGWQWPRLETNDVEHCLANPPPHLDRAARRFTQFTLGALGVLMSNTHD